MQTRILIPAVFLTLISLFAAACGAIPSGGAGKPLQIPIEFSGKVQSISGNQWTIDDRTVTVDLSVAQDGQFKAGDTVKVSASPQADGSLLVTRVESESGQDVQTSDSTETPEAQATTTGSVPSSDILKLSGRADEAFGLVDSISTSTIVIGGQTFSLAQSVEVNPQIAVGSFVKIQFVTNADGSRSIVEIKASDPNTIGTDANNGENHQAEDGAANDSNDDGSDGHDSGGADSP